MQSFIEQAKNYSLYHQKTITRYTHFVGVPLLVFSFMLLFSFLHLTVPGYFSRTSAELLTLALFLYYLVLNWRLALSLAPVLILLLWLADWIGGDGPTSGALTVFLACFIVGWIVQLLGHLFEGHRPAFTKNLCQFLIAPLYLTAEVYFMFGKMQALQTAIHQDNDENSKQ